MDERISQHEKQTYSAAGEKSRWMRLPEKSIHGGGGGGGGGSVAGTTAVVAAAAVAASSTRYFWNCRIRHSEQTSTTHELCRFLYASVEKKSARSNGDTGRYDLNIYPAKSQEEIVTR